MVAESTIYQTVVGFDSAAADLAQHALEIKYLKGPHARIRKITLITMSAPYFRTGTLTLKVQSTKNIGHSGFLG